MHHAAAMRFLLLPLLLSSALAVEDKSFTLLTEEGLALQPEALRMEWKRYLDRSRASAVEDRRVLAVERTTAVAQPAPGSRAEFELASATPAEWFGSPEAVELAQTVISYQTPAGGWSKAVDYAAGPRQPGVHWTSQHGDEWHYCGTFDNRSTTEQIKLLAGVFTATDNRQVQAALMKGLEYLLAAQYPNGGWPQNYPVERGYHEAITLNDSAMTHVLEVLLAVSKGEKAFAFADQALRQRAAEALRRGITCLAAMQVKIGGHPAVWCAQHHPLTLEPVGARLKEPPSLSGAESADLVKFLMRSAPVTPEVVAMVEGALRWFEASRITGLRKTKDAKGKTAYVSDPSSTEILWARFYDLHTGKPIFAGADDGVIYSNYGEMAAKNRVGYDFFTPRPGELLEKEVARWRKRLP
jgi:PelA/Pel-15E family pectate lyase